MDGTRIFELQREQEPDKDDLLYLYSDEGVDRSVSYGDLLNLPDGSPAAPAMAFRNAPMSGVYLRDDGGWGFSVGGNTVMWLTPEALHVALLELDNLEINNVSADNLFAEDASVGQLSATTLTVTNTATLAGLVVQGDGSVSGDFSVAGVITGDGGGITNIQDAALPATIVRTSRQVATGDGLAGGGDLSGDRTLGLEGQALALHQFAGSGLMVRTGSASYVARTIQGGDGINLSNGNGVSGNPSVAVDSTVVRTSRQVATGDGLAGGGDLSGDRTLAVDATVVRTGGDQTIGGAKTFTGPVGAGEVVGGVGGIVFKTEDGTQRALLSSAAFQIDVPVTGDATTQSADDTTNGLLARFHGPRGIMGIGGSRAIVNTDWDNIIEAGFYTNGSTSSESVGGPGSYTHMSLLHMQADTFGSAAQIAIRDSDASPEIYFRSANNAPMPDNWGEIYHTGNTTVDGSGNIMEASPVVRLFNDVTEEPNQPVGATMQRVGPGHYTLTDCPPLATEGWRIRTPTDVNGNKLVAITEPEYDTDTETLTVRTFDLLWSEGRLVPGDPMDIPEGEFVMLRFDSPDEEAA